MFFWLNFFSLSLSTMTTLVPLTDGRPGTCSITTFLCERREEWVSLSCWVWLISCSPPCLLPTLTLGSVLRSLMTMHCPLHRCCRWGQQLCGDLVHQPTVCKSLTREYVRLQDDGLYETSLVSGINHLLSSQLLALLQRTNTFSLV